METDTQRCWMLAGTANTAMSDSQPPTPAERKGWDALLGQTLMGSVPQGGGMETRREVLGSEPPWPRNTVGKPPCSQDPSH